VVATEDASDNLVLSKITPAGAVTTQTIPVPRNPSQIPETPDVDCAASGACTVILGYRLAVVTVSATGVVGRPVRLHPLGGGRTCTADRCVLADPNGTTKYPWASLFQIPGNGSGRAQQAPVPADADPDQPFYPNQVACASDTMCAVTGRYTPVGTSGSRSYLAVGPLSSGSSS